MSESGKSGIPAVNQVRADLLEPVVAKVDELVLEMAALATKITPKDHPYYNGQLLLNLNILTVQVMGMITNASMQIQATAVGSSVQDTN